MTSRVYCIFFFLLFIFFPSLSNICLSPSPSFTHTTLISLSLKPFSSYYSYFISHTLPSTSPSRPLFFPSPTFFTSYPVLRVLHCFFFSHIYFPLSLPLSHTLFDPLSLFTHTFLSHFLTFSLTHFLV